MKNIRLILIQLHYGLQQDLAYRKNNIANMFSTFAYTVLFVAFIEVLFQNIDSIGIYTRDDLLFMTILGQFSFYYLAAVPFVSAVKTADDINNGKMDYLLIRPVSHKLLVMFNNPKLLILIRDGFPIFIVASLVNWSKISTSISQVIIGLLIMLIGLLIMSHFILVLSLLAFWTGKSKNTVDVFWGLVNKTEHPIEAMVNPLKFGSLIALPTLIPVSAAGTVMLGKAENIAAYIAVSVLLLVFWMGLSSLVWRKGIRSYASASS